MLHPVQADHSVDYNEGDGDDCFWGNEENDKNSSMHDKEPFWVLVQMLFEVVDKITITRLLVLSVVAHQGHLVCKS